LSNTYHKQALTFEDQLNQLVGRGLEVNDRDTALSALSSISYYRLSAYWFPFRQRNTDGSVLSILQPGTSLDEVIKLYEFDRHLRLSVMDAIERVEVAIRTQLTYHMAHAYGAFAHNDSSNFHPNFRHAQWLSKLEQETDRSSDEFIRHYKSKYEGFPTVPIWMVTEVMSLGSLSLFYKGLKNNRREGVEDKKAIADRFDVHHKRLAEWLHTLTYVRNVCAHHSRLWNRELAIRPDQNRDPSWSRPITPRNDRIFYILLILRHLLRSTGNGDEWAASLNELLAPIAVTPKYRIAMGMPENWREHPIWK
tara:strand:- start:4215 stop:5138 length:924 start_codon:yes stop_codon:yes gene_type:complete